MAAFLLLLCFTFHIISSLSQTPTFPNSVFFPVTKDFSTLQYTTQIYMGTPLFPTKLVLDLGGPFLWADCTAKSPSSSRRAIPSGSLQCSTATSDTECGLYPENTITRMEQAGELAEDIMAIDYVDGVKARSIATVHHFLFSCAPTLLLKGLASGAKGMLGLGRSRISLPSQLANTFGFHRKFAICLSESEGVIISGDGLSLSGSDISKSLMYTPLISSKEGTTEEYYINVKSVKISGNRLSHYNY